ncbi:hypothetical protein AJ80_05213 [Polytolypa hystricis UAMH7299]|uniref:Uncharacterized protein n=1 Tax=Polytolypa hystricis (strain UAMH7299) TaxID=1447883 RepID=A0A2B7Y5R4_POLH7|nr:hypothetical protein AJ80_05213 [Polytolypa hystricis UAMH7299]
MRFSYLSVFALVATLGAATPVVYTEADLPDILSKLAEGIPISDGVIIIGPPTRTVIPLPTRPGGPTRTVIGYTLEFLN